MRKRKTKSNEGVFIIHLILNVKNEKTFFN